MVTSSIASEGKSSTSANLGLALAESGASVCVIEGDLRRPKLLDDMGLEGSVGLTDVLIGRYDLVDVIQPFGRLSLSILGAGPTPPNPSELLGSTAMRDVLAELRRSYDYVIIDAPPLLPVTDGAVLPLRRMARSSSWAAVSSLRTNSTTRWTRSRRSMANRWAPSSTACRASARVAITTTATNTSRTRPRAASRRTVARRQDLGEGSGRRRRLDENVTPDSRHAADQDLQEPVNPVGDIGEPSAGALGSSYVVVPVRPRRARATMARSAGPGCPSRRTPTRPACRGRRSSPPQACAGCTSPRRTSASAATFAARVAPGAARITASARHR